MLEFSLTYFICDCSSLLLPVFPGASVPGFFFLMKASKRKSGSESTQKSKSQRALVDGSVSESTVDDSGPVKLFTSWLPLAFFQKPFAVALLPILFPFVFWLRPVLSATGRTTWKRTRALTVIWPAR